MAVLVSLSNCLAHALIATCQLWAWCVLWSDSLIAPAPDFPPDVREEPGLEFQSVSMVVPVHLVAEL